MMIIGSNCNFGITLTDMDSLDMTFEIPNTKENRDAWEKLRKECLESPMTIYGTDANNNLFPIANIEKHPDCPEGWYKRLMDAMLRFKCDEL